MARAPKGLRRTSVVVGARRVPQFHAHGCLGCGRRYSDSCLTPFADGRCTTCLNGHPPALWDRDRAPQPCCRTESKPITDGATLERYALGGLRTWFICKVCRRTHPINPKEQA